MPPFEFKINADFVAAAVTNKQLYDAYVDAGFSPAQAMQILCSMLKAHMSTSMMIERGIFEPPDGEV